MTSHNSHPPKWLYYVGAFAHGAANHEQQAERLTELGLAGWELISIVTEERAGGLYNMFYFKRPADISPIGSHSSHRPVNKKPKKS